ncbi:hypothetical protein PYCC9005_003157 [Savitreella phatthalungensis]
MSTLNEEEKKMLSKYGKLPQRKDLLSSKLKERKYFDSGDYALSKAGKASDAGITNIGSQFPNPENIPHSPSVSGGSGSGSSGGHTSSSSFSSGSPVKDSSLLAQQLPSSTQAYSKESEEAIE